MTDHQGKHSDQETEDRPRTQIGRKGGRLDNVMLVLVLTDEYGSPGKEGQRSSRQKAQRLVWVWSVLRNCLVYLEFRLVNC